MSYKKVIYKIRYILESPKIYLQSIAHYKSVQNLYHQAYTAFKHPKPNKVLVEHSEVDSEPTPKWDDNKG